MSHRGGLVLSDNLPNLHFVLSLLQLQPETDWHSVAPCTRRPQGELTFVVLSVRAHCL